MDKEVLDLIVDVKNCIQAVQMIVDFQRNEINDLKNRIDKLEGEDYAEKKLRCD